MTTPKKITEAQAQEWANNTGCIITQNRNGKVDLWIHNFPIGSTSDGYWTMMQYCNPKPLPILIDSTRQWTEQIWRPE